jgi:hypothetical protein
VSTNSTIAKQKYGRDEQEGLGDLKGFIPLDLRPAEMVPQRIKGGVPKYN